MKIIINDDLSISRTIGTGVGASFEVGLCEWRYVYLLPYLELGAQVEVGLDVLVAEYGGVVGPAATAIPQSAIRHLYKSNMQYSFNFE